MGEEKERKNQDKEEAKELSRHKKLAEVEIKDKNNVKKTNPKGKKQRRYERRRGDQRAKRGDPVIHQINQA